MMIKIDRHHVSIPQELADPAATSQERWRLTRVREALSQMQHGKCCYCEKKIDTSGSGQAVEHYRPKGVGEFVHLADTWTNLLHACSDCNGAKGSKFPLLEDGSPALIDPSDPTTDPEDHIDFPVDDEDDLAFASAIPKDKSARGARTVKALKLDVAGRRRARAAHFKDLLSAYLDILAADPATRDAKVRAFRARLGADHPYTAFARAFARKKNAEKRFDIAIPMGAQLG